jgi:hypothetical protein
LLLVRNCNLNIKLQNNQRKRVLERVSSYFFIWWNDEIE